MEVVVETRDGRLAGRRHEGLQSFRGIPFAAPPVGARRFGAPRPPAPWSGVRDATRFGPSAPQVEISFPLMPGLEVGEQDEDCLYLNVYTPCADGGRRPVMVWIHGGAFTIGSGSQPFYDVRPLVRRGDVVVVTLNYRLGALGFLHLTDLVGESFGATANAGLLDQVAALAWVRDNVAAFGGDPEQVTVFGESAGGMSAGTLLGMPAAAGLFRRAIPMSGAAHRVNPRDAANEVAERWLRELGISPDEPEKLRGAPVDALLAAQRRTLEAIEGGQVARAFCPTIDGHTLPEPPIEAIRAGRSREVDVLVGCTRDEWRLFALMDPDLAKLDEAALLERCERRVPGTAADGTPHARRLLEVYRAARPGASPADLFVALETDRVFRIPAVRLAEAQSAHPARTWAYLVCWESPLMDGALGACHGIDVPFLLGGVGTRGAEAFAGAGAEAEALRDAMMDAWLAFARCGDPNHPDLPDWPPYDARRRATMRLDRRCEVEDDPFPAERRAWDGIL